MGRVAACVLMLVLMLGGVGPCAESQNVVQRGSRPELARGALRPGAARGPGTTQSETAPAAAAALETSVGSVLRNLASRAGVVFVGQVVKIEPKAGTVEVTFQVQQPVLGAVGATYTLREWSGLWTGGRQRYRLGQRAMVFLHATNGPGLSSPVDGMEGVVPVVVQGADTGALLDVRWLDARVLRDQGAPLADAENGAITLADGIAVAAGWKNAELPEPVQQPLPLGVRPAQTAEPVQSVGVAVPPRPEPVVAKPFGVPLQPAALLKSNSPHDMVLIAAPGGSDAIR